MGDKIFRAFKRNAHSCDASARLVTRLQRPRVVEVETVNICNALCGFCVYKNNIPKRQEMAEDTFRNAVEQIAKLGTDEFVLVPLLGDPLLDRKLMSRLETLSTKETLKTVRLVTNGLALNSWSDEDLEFLLGTVDRLEISIGPNRHVYKEMFGLDRFEHLISQLERLAGLIEKASDKPRHIEFCGRACGASFEVDQRLIAIADRICTVKPIEWLTQYLDWGGKIENLPLETEIVRGEDIDQSKAPCTYALAPHVYADGEVGLCACAGADTSLKIGSLTTHDWQEILQSDKRLEMILSFLKNEQPSYCRNCSFYKPERSLAWQKLVSDFEEKNA